MSTAADDIHAFVPHVPEAELVELRSRLAAARLPEAETVDRAAAGRRRWEQGVPLDDLVTLVDYWRTGYDWRCFEGRLKQIGQFSTTIDGLGFTSCIVGPPVRTPSRCS